MVKIKYCFVIVLLLCSCQSGNNNTLTTSVTILNKSLMEEIDCLSAYIDTTNEDALHTHGIAPKRCNLMICVRAHDGDTIVDLIAYDTMYTNERQPFFVKGHLVTRDGLFVQISDTENIGDGVLYTSVIDEHEVFVDITHALQRSLILHKGELAFILN